MAKIAEFVDFVRSNNGKTLDLTKKEVLERFELSEAEYNSVIRQLRQHGLYIHFRRLGRRPKVDISNLLNLNVSPESKKVKPNK